MRYMKVIGFVISSMFLMFFVACKDDNPTDKAASITITPKSLNLRVGEVGTLNVTRRNTDDFTLQSGMASGCVKSNIDLVTCTPTATGTYPITVTATADTTKSATATVMVTTTLPEDNDPIITPPSAPLNLTAEPGNGQVKLSWSAPDNDGGSAITGYEVEISFNNGSTWEKVSTPNTSVTFIYLMNEISYNFRVRAVNDAGNGAVAEINDIIPTADVVPGQNLAEKLSWLQTNAGSGMDYIIDVNTNESIFPASLFYGGINDVTITLRGIGSTRTISLASNGSMFSVESGVTLVLDNNITLQGRSSNDYPLVCVHEDGTLIMNTGSTITGNYSSGSTDLVQKCEVTTTLTGGGVYVNGNFTMNGGTISNNSAGEGGGVNVNGNFTMNSGTISANSGGGVNVHGTFTMNDGTISGNTTEVSGGGVSVIGTFAMNGGSILDNYAPYGGGGVFVTRTIRVVPPPGISEVYPGIFTMSGGIISGNITTRGGGVMVYGTFSMSNGTIFGNTAQGWGGGVILLSNSSFTKTGGTITGYTSDTLNGNVVRNAYGTVLSNSGHAVYAEDSDTDIIVRKESTAGPGVNLWWDNTGSSPNWSGGWDTSSGVRDGGQPRDTGSGVRVGPPTTPSAPQNFIAEPGNRQVALSWMSPDSDGGSSIESYEVSSNNGLTWVNVSTNTIYTFAGLENGTSYTFRVRAVNAVGNGAEAAITSTPRSGGGAQFVWRLYNLGDGEENGKQEVFAGSQRETIRKH